MTAKYQIPPPTAAVPAPGDLLEEIARSGARRLLQAALEAEVKEFLGRSRYQRKGDFRGYRNGHLPERTVGVGMGTVGVRIPRVRDIPEGVAEGGFSSQIVRHYERRSQTQGRLLCRLYLERLSSGDFEPVFRALVGATAALSPNSILRVKQEWQAEYQLWRARPLTDRYAYIFADGIYLKAALEHEKTVLLVLVGVRADGQKELLAIEEGYRESRESLAVGDGALGLWAALDEVFPKTRHRRCWNHRSLNVLDKLPKRLHKEARRRIRAMYQAEDRNTCTTLRAYCAELRSRDQADAASCLERDREDFTAFYDFPEEHWTHLRTSNPIESIFAGVRLRTNATKRMRVRDNVLYLVFKLATRLSTSWRAINAPNQLHLLLDGHRFVDGKLQLTQPSPEDVAA